MKIRFLYSLALLLVTGLAQAESKPYLSTRVISMELANQLAMSAAQACRKKGYQVAVSVVDRGGNLLAVVRDPLAGAHTVDVSLRKAQTAATFQTDTITMQKQGEEFAGLRFAKNVLIIGGGIPVRVGGHFYGAVAVSGAPGQKITGDIDHQCAQAGIDTIKEAIEFAE
jgi:uncharacterized protein GlcG (DUF336 family)